MVGAVVLGKRDGAVRPSTMEAVMDEPVMQGPVTENTI
jgi:hypothetical protein